MSDFYPISPLVGITNTSYGAQVGVMEEKWAVRVVRGKKIIAEKPIPSLDLDNIVGVAYGHIRVEGLSRHAVATMSGRLMQYARKYQQSGVCPDYEIAELTYDDGTTVGDHAIAAEGGVTSTETEESVLTSLPDLRVGEIPEIPRAIGDDAWQSVLESQASLICEISAYASTLPTGHLDLMFSKAADQIINVWAQSNTEDPSIALKKFGALIQSCSRESQLPKTGTGTASIEARNCEILRICRELDPSAAHIPSGYPCTFHEMIAKKISELSGIRISVNTSSTGCTVNIKLE